MKVARLLALLLLSAGGLAGAAPAKRVLFLGNSLTCANDLPALVAVMAKCGGFDLDCTARAKPDFALEDHWSDGARGTVRRGKFDAVVLQQGPSTRPESRANLREWARRWAEFAREHGAEPALYMVWPFATQRSGFLLVSESYREAAEASGARILPAGEAWALAYHADPALRLYAPDGLHPTGAGSFLAALVIARGLTGLDPARVPAQLQLPDSTTVSVDKRQAALFRAIVGQLRYGEAAALVPVPVTAGSR